MHGDIRRAARRALYLQTCLQLHSNRELYLENCRRIIESHDIRIVVQTTDLLVEIWGRGLQTDSCSPECLRITGEIQSLTLTPKGVRHGTASAG